MHKIIQRKLKMFAHICRMKDDRTIKILMFGIMGGNNKRGRLHQEWMDDIVDWHGRLTAAGVCSPGQTRVERHCEEDFKHLRALSYMVVDD